MKKTAVVLLNLGGPSCQKEVRPFLFSLFYDPAIVSLPNPFRYIFAILLTQGRLKAAHRIYARLGGGSPLLKNTRAQATALERELGLGFRVFVAMRHAPPFAHKTLEEVKAYDPHEVILLPLYPQYSTTTTASSLKAWQTSAQGWNVPTSFICSYPTQKGFLEAMKELTLPLYRKAAKYGIPRILLTAHGLPEKIIQKGDPYQDHIEKTAKNFILSLGLSSPDFVVCYQSRIGPLTWIGPSTKEEIMRAAQEKRPLVIVPLSFVSEHSETLVELDMTYRHLALQGGCPAYYRVQTVQTHPSFIQGLASLVKKGGTHAF